MNVFGSTGSGSFSVRGAVGVDAERAQADEPLVGAEQPQLVELAVAGRLEAGDAHVDAVADKARRLPLAAGSRSPTGCSASCAEGDGLAVEQEAEPRARGEQDDRAGRGDEGAQDEPARPRGERARVAGAGLGGRQRAAAAAPASSQASAGSRSRRVTTGRSRSTSSRSVASAAIARSKAAVSAGSSSPSR